MFNLLLKHLTTSTLTLVLALQAANAIVMRHDLVDGEQAYLDLAKPYNSVAYISGNGRSATGFLVSSTQLITAGHLVDRTGGGVGGDEKDGIADSATYTVQFSTNGTSFTNTYNTSNASVNSLYSTSSQYDIAVLTFSTPITGYTPMALSTANPFGHLGTMVGYGTSGFGDTFDIGGGNYTWDDKRRAAHNLIDSQDSRFYLTDFDSPTSNTSSYGSATPLALEGGSAPGDSGGPLIVNGEVIGIVQGGYSNAFGPSAAYGDRATWVRINDPDNMSYLTGLGIAVVPEPSSTLLLGMGLMTIGLLRKRV